MEHSKSSARGDVATGFSRALGDAAVAAVSTAGVVARAANMLPRPRSASHLAISGDGAGRFGLFFFPVLPTGAARASTTWAVSQLLSRYVLRSGRDVGQLFRAAREACTSASASVTFVSPAK